MRIQIDSDSHEFTVERMTMWLAKTFVRLAVGNGLDPTGSSDLLGKDFFPLRFSKASATKHPVIIDLGKVDDSPSEMLVRLNVDWGISDAEKTEIIQKKIRGRENEIRSSGAAFLLYAENANSPEHFEPQVLRDLVREIGHHFS